MPYFEKLYKNDELPHRAKLVYIYLYDRCDSEGKAWPSVKRIAKDLSISEKTVRRAVQDLVKAGLVRKECAYRDNGSHTSNRYYFFDFCIYPTKGSVCPNGVSSLLSI